MLDKFVFINLLKIFILWAIYTIVILETFIFCGIIMIWFLFTIFANKPFMFVVVLKLYWYHKYCRGKRYIIFIKTWLNMFFSFWCWNWFNIPKHYIWVEFFNLYIAWINQRIMDRMYIWIFTSYLQCLIMCIICCYLCNIFKINLIKTSNCNIIPTMNKF